MLRCPRCSRGFDPGLQHRFCPLDGAALADDATLLGATLLGQFELREIIGEGASGTVYRAWQAPMERWVAVKVLHRELADDPAMVARMEREARAVGRLAHPGVVTVYAAGTAPGGQPFLVMELIDGDTLDDAAAGAPMPAARVIQIGREIADALGASHDAGVIHRDLKPSNVMLVGRAARVVVLDFGVAKLVGGALVNGSGQLTADGAICGTPHYIAPEQASGEPVDHRADLYSLGVVLYELATGRLPFDGNPVAVLLGHVQDPVVPPEAIAPVPPRLSAVIKRCLAKDPAARFRDAGELADALAACHREPSWNELAPTIEVATLSAGDTARLPVRRGARIFSSLLALVIACAAGAAGTAAWLDRPAPPSVAAAPTPPEVVRRPAAAAERVRGPDVVSSAAPAPGRAVIVSQDGYSLRLLLPERIVVGVDYEILLEVWDPQGEPIATSEMVLTLDDPSESSRGVAAKPTDQPGVYRFSRRFDSAGAHQLRVYPPAGGASMRVFVEVVDASLPST